MSGPGSRYYDAQVGVIGSVLIDAPHVAGMVMHRTREDDYTGELKTIFQACRTLFQQGRPIDPVTVRGIVGPAYDQRMKEWMDYTPTAANVEIYIDLTVEQAKLTRLQGLSLQLAGATNLEDAQKIMAQANRIMGGRPGIRIVNMEQGLLDFYERQRKPANLVPWGIDKVDDTLRAEYGDFLVLGGYPSAGKTAFSLQLAWNQARNRRVGYFSLETKPEKIIDRTVAAVCGVDFGRIKGHTLTEADWTECEQRAGVFVGRNLDVIQAGGLSVVDIQALSLAGRYDIIYIDYLQLITPEDRRRPDFEQVTQISKDLHTMAQTTGITIVALSQLSRPPKSGEQEKSPGLHSLRQSGQIEQDADGVMLLYKEEPTNPRSRRCLKIAKNKEGEAGGIVMLNFDGIHQRFSVSMGTPAKPKPREPEYKQATLYNLPGGEPLTWEELTHGQSNRQNAPHSGGGGPAAPSTGNSCPGARGSSPGNSPCTGNSQGAVGTDLPF